SNILAFPFSRSISFPRISGNSLNQGSGEDGCMPESPSPARDKRAATGLVEEQCYMPISRA
ncbi:MAG: hypothetical protein KAT58_06570, partial [candidate division Zixibacteria bacterium]|nr:hypothetical protein [candidate division Zixibacteria bacterium]